MLGILQTPFGRVAGRKLPSDYTRFLRRGALRGARIGVDRRYSTTCYFGFPGDEDSLPLFFEALDVMRSLGATLIETDTGDVFDVLDDEFTTLLFEFKVQIEEYSGR